MAINQAHVFAITSVKGGVGKTITTLNLAGILSKRNKKTLIIDLDLYGSAIAASLKLSNETDVYKMVDDLNNNRFNSIDDYIVSYNEFIDVLPGPKDLRFANKINSKYLGVVINRAKLKYDVILIDTNHILDEKNLVTMDLADEIVYLMSNDLIDIKNMKTMVSILKDMDKKNYKIVLNNARDKLRNHFTIYDIKNIINDNIDYVIPSEFYLKNFDKYAIDGKIPVLDKKINIKNKKTIKVFEMLVTSLLKNKK